MSIEIRPMQMSDAAAVNRLAAQLGYPDTIEATEQHIARLLPQQTHCLLVATDRDTVIGWLHALEITWLETGTFTEIAGLVVDEQQRGKRAGESLVNAALQWCRDRRCHRVCLRSNVRRTEAHRFYRRLGFEEIKESKVFEMLLQS